MSDSPEVIGQPSVLAGAICEQLLCQQYWYCGELTAEINVVFLRFDGVWHRLCFDCGIIFWRICDAPPTSTEAPEIGASYPLIDLGTQLALRGERLDHYDMKTIQGGSRAEFMFSSGHAVVFQSINDITALVK